MMWKGSAIYEGYFSHGKRHGHGRMIYAVSKCPPDHLRMDTDSCCQNYATIIGAVYTGQFERGEINGIGEYQGFVEDEINLEY